MESRSLFSLLMTPRSTYSKVLLIIRAHVKTIIIRCIPVSHFFFFPAAITVRQPENSISSVMNNSIVNSFSIGEIESRKRRNVGGHQYQVECITVQGDHNPVWSVALLLNRAVDLVINGSLSNISTMSSNPTYVSSLSVIVNNDTSGRYTCRSAVSGVSLSFLLVTGLCVLCSSSSLLICQPLICPPCRRPLFGVNLTKDSYCIPGYDCYNVLSCCTKQRWI